MNPPNASPPTTSTWPVMTVPNPPAPPGLVPNADALPSVPLAPWTVIRARTAYCGAVGLKYPGVVNVCDS